MKINGKEYSNISIAKTAVTSVVGLGSSKIIKTIIQNNVQPEGIVDKTTVAAGSYALGAMVADVSKRYTHAKIDRTIALWRKAFEDLEQSKQEQPTTEQ